MSLVASVPCLNESNRMEEVIQNSKNDRANTSSGIINNSGGPLGRYNTFNTNSSNRTWYGAHFGDKCTQLSVSCWVRPYGNGGAWNDIWELDAKRNSDNSGQIVRLEFNGGSNYGVFANGVLAPDLCGNYLNMPTNQWSHIIFCFNIEYNKTTFTYYLNGIKQWEIVSNYGNAYFTGAFSLGDSNIGFDMCDFKIFNHVVSREEAKELHSRLLLHYPFGSYSTNMLTVGANGIPYYSFNVAGSVINGTPNYQTSNQTYLGQKINKWYGSSSNAWTGPYYPLSNLGSTLIVGKIYTISAYMKADTPTYIQMGNFAESQPEIESKNYIGTDWTRVYKTFTATSTNPAVCFYTNNNASTTKPWIYMTGLMLCPGYYEDSFNSYYKILPKDSSGHGLHALAGNIAYSSKSINGTSSAAFNGVNTFVSTPKCSKISDEFSVNVWVHKDDWTVDSNSNYEIMSCTEGGGWGILCHSAYSYNIAVEIYDKGIGYKSAVSNVKWGSLSSGWHMITMIFTGSVCKLYLDKNLIATSPSFSSGQVSYYPHNSVFIGAEPGGNTSSPIDCFFNGNIDDVRIYTKILSQDEINNLYTIHIKYDNNISIHCPQYNEFKTLSMDNKGNLNTTDGCETSRKVRYVRLSCDGSNKNGGNHISLCKVITAYNTEITIANSSVSYALPTISGSLSGPYGNGDWYDQPKSIVFDLGKVYDISGVYLRRYWQDSRYYYKNKIEVSENNSNWISVFDSHNQGSYGSDNKMNTYVETRYGRWFVIPNDNNIIYTHKLPVDYQEVEFIKGDASQYIDTGIKLNLSKDKFEVKYQTDVLEGNYFILGAGSTQANAFWLYHYNAGGRLTLYAYDSGGTQRSEGYIKNDTTSHIIKYDRGQFIIDNEYLGNFAQYTYGESPYNVDLFGSHIFSGTQYSLNGKIYYAKFYKSDSLVRDFIPCYRKSDGVIGMYDLVQQKFYTKNTGNNFTKSSVELNNDIIISNEIIEE